MKPYGRKKHDGYNTDPYIKSARAAERLEAETEIAEQCELVKPMCPGCGCYLSEGCECGW